MRALRRHPVVERVHREIDQRVGQPSVAVAIVVLARAPGQWLQRGSQSRASDLVEEAFDQQGAVVGRVQVETARLDAFLLLVDEALGVGRMLGVQTGVVKLEHALLASVAQEPGLVKLLTDPGCSPRDVRDVGETDLAGSHRRRALGQPLQLLADADPIGGGAAGHVAVGLDPLDRTVEALQLVLIGPGEPGRDQREHELVLIHLDAATSEPFRHLRTGLG